MTDEILKGEDFVALRRLSLADNTTIASVGETCERVPAAKVGTQSDALRRLLESGKIMRKVDYVAQNVEPAVDVAGSADAPAAVAPRRRRRGGA